MPRSKLECEVEIRTDAATFHEVVSRRPHHVSKMTPSKVQGVNLHEGAWGSQGSVISWNYVHDGVPKFAKEIIEAIDDANLCTTFRVIEGDVLKEFKNFTLTVKATPKASGEGSVVHWTFEYEKLHKDIPDPHSLLQLGIHMSKDIDNHHIAQAN